MFCDTPFLAIFFPQNFEKIKLLKLNHERSIREVRNFNKQHFVFLSKFLALNLRLRLIKEQCLRNGQLFEDPEFPANNSSVDKNTNPPVELKWLRPKEICQNPQFFSHGASRLDIQQGRLGQYLRTYMISCPMLFRSALFQETLGCCRLLRR